MERKTIMWLTVLAISTWLKIFGNNYVAENNYVADYIGDALRGSCYAEPPLCFVDQLLAKMGKPL